MTWSRWLSPGGPVSSPGGQRGSSISPKGRTAPIRSGAWPLPSSSPYPDSTAKAYVGDLKAGATRCAEQGVHPFAARRHHVDTWVKSIGREPLATELLSAGVPLQDVQDAMGHADPRTARRYDRSRHNLDRHPTYKMGANLRRYDGMTATDASHELIGRAAGMPLQDVQAPYHADPAPLGPTIAPGTTSTYAMAWLRLRCAVSSCRRPRALARRWQDRRCPNLGP